jgi:hypothetical protein
MSDTKLELTVNMTVPAHTRVRQIWFAIGHGHDGIGDGPINEQPILFHRVGRFAAGQHRFDLTWQVPAQIGPMTSLTATYQGTFGEVGNEIAFFKPLAD